MRERLKRAWCFYLVAIFAGSFFGCDEESSESYKIAVWAQLESGSYRSASAWARDNINQAGVLDKPIELVFYEQTSEEVQTTAEKLANDDSILAVVGISGSQNLYDVADHFIKAKKVVVSASSTSAEIPRTFSGETNIWRTTESDIAQTKALLTLASRDHSEKGPERPAAKVALLTSFNKYGDTFYDWMGFYSIELSMQITNMVRYEQSGSVTDCVEPLEVALGLRAMTDDQAEDASEVFSETPDYLIVAQSYPEDIACVLNRFHEIDRRGGFETTPKLLFTDTGASELIEAFVDEPMDMVGMEGLTLGPDHSSNWSQLYYDVHQESSGNYAANIYDAVSLIGYGLAYTSVDQDLTLDAAIRKAVTGRGTKTGWTAEGIENALKAIVKGKLPNITGATGDLNYDSTYFIDMTSSTYLRWQYDGTEFMPFQYIRSAPSTDEVSLRAAYRSLASEDKLKPVGEFESGTHHQVESLTELWALLVATSAGWDNYRHQADVLAQYQLLRSQGLPDERIVLIVADDIANNSLNKLPGVVRYHPDGANVYEEANIDYRLGDISVELLSRILKGDKDYVAAELGITNPEVINSTINDNVYIFFSGHGGKKGIALNGNDVEGGLNGGHSIEFFRPQKLYSTLTSMAENNQYRRLLVAIEACHAGVYGDYFTKKVKQREAIYHSNNGGLDGFEPPLPRVLVLTGATGWENSRASNRDRELDAWLADEFAYSLHQHLSTLISEEAAGSDSVSAIGSSYGKLYQQVPGSHVSLYNTSSFGDIESISLVEFFRSDETVD